MEYIIDANNRPLGRVATEAARILQGKHTPKYRPNHPGSDKVIVKNVQGVHVSGKKYGQKIYYRHTGYMGHLKEKTYAQVFEKNPKDVFRHAVRGMLPKNFLTDRRLKRLVIE